MDNISRVPGIEISSLGNQQSDTQDVSCSQVDEILSREDIIEKNKDKLDLKPNIDFISENIEIYEVALRRLLESDILDSSLLLAEKVLITNEEDIVHPQISGEEALEIIKRLPETLTLISDLDEIGYHTFGTFVKKIPVPGYFDDGNFDQSGVELVDVDKFPREGEHPSRILVGVSDGKKIYPTPIPNSVSEDETVTYLYQLHVFLHEFFHTIDYTRRSTEERSKLVFDIDGERFTFQDWWDTWESLFLSGTEPICVSSYANTYINNLNTYTKENDYKTFTHALAEQICESFVAYQLGIISNDDGWTNFKEESFGNVHQLQKYIKGDAKSANLKWLLIDKLCKSQLISK